MANAKRTDSVMSRFAKINHSREHIEALTKDAKAKEIAIIGGLLAECENGDDCKKLRKGLRRRGHYISKAGKPWANAAKRLRKATADVVLGEPTQPTADEANGVTNAV